MEGTRLRILQLLQKNTNDTVDGLARAIGLAAATIRRHLDILQRDRLVAFEEVRKKTGRPEYSFFLTEDGQEALPKDYDMLLGLMIGELADLSVDDTMGRDGEGVLELVFQRLSGRVFEDHRQEVEGQSLEVRLKALLRLLGDEDFYPEANFVDGTLRIRLINCPFRSVALRSKAVCTFDSNIISSMLDMAVSQEMCINDGADGCVYIGRVDEKTAATSPSNAEVKAAS